MDSNSCFGPFTNLGPKLPPYRLGKCQFGWSKAQRVMTTRDGGNDCPTVSSFSLFVYARFTFRSTSHGNYPMELQGRLLVINALYIRSTCPEELFTYKLKFRLLRPF